MSTLVTLALCLTSTAEHLDSQTPSRHPVLMADERLQQLRRASDQGNLDAQVRLLRERMRAGELSTDRVRLAASLGNEAAGHAMNEVDDSPAEIGDWGLEVLDQPWSWLRAGVALTRLVLSECDPAHRTPDLQAALEYREADVALGKPQPVHVSFHGPMTTTGRPLADAWRVHRAVDCGVSVGERHAAPLRRCLRLASQITSPSRAKDALRRELVPWALGLRDPVAERVAAREAGGSEAHSTTEQP